jgi:4-hydroxybenzoate polyprenyltransferase
MASAISVKEYLRTLLVLGRISNLPTVWSNCLAGWLLGNGGEYSRLVAVCLAGSFIYLGGMFLNDVFDVEFDREHRCERPIPAGAISETAVWYWGFGWLSLGLLVMAGLGGATTVLALLLVGAVLVYDAVHKRVAFAPALMACIRFLLYLVAGSVSAAGISGLTVWSGLVLGAYVAGLSQLAAHESNGRPIQYWPCALLLAPLVLAYVVNADAERTRPLVLSVLVLAWVVWCCRHALAGPKRDLGRTVAGLLPGIILVDLLAVAPEAFLIWFTFLAFFGAALALQRFAPAT